MFNKITLALLCLVLSSSVTKAQLGVADTLSEGMKDNSDQYEEGWNKGGSLNIGFAQSHLANWAAGGEINAMNINGILNGNYTYKSGRALWDNTYYASYGLNFLQSNDFIPQKTDDRLDIASKYGLQMANRKNWYWSGLARLQTQFSAGYNYDSTWKADPKNAPEISQFFSPAYITLGLGAEYKPNNNFSWFISPAAFRFTFVNAKYTAERSNFGVPLGETSRIEFGAYSTLVWTTNLAPNISYRTRLDNYLNYLDKKGFGNIDWLWDNLFTFKVNEYIGMTLGFTMIYDNDVIPADLYAPDGKTYLGVNNVPDHQLGWTQLKQNFTVGLSRKF